MIHEWFLSIYNMHYYVLLVVTILLLAAGGLLHFSASDKVKHIVGVIGTACALWIVIYATLLSRHETGGGLMLKIGRASCRERV